MLKRKQQMKIFKFEVIIDEDDSEFWDEIGDLPGTGCDFVLENVQSRLNDMGAVVVLREFKDQD